MEWLFNRNGQDKFKDDIDIDVPINMLIWIIERFTKKKYKSKIIS